MIPADQARLYLDDPIEPRRPVNPSGQSALDLRNVQTDATVTAVQFNRYADPARPDELMHEAHLVYRRDSAPHWKLHAPVTGEQILIGPQLTDGRGEIKPLVAPELDAYLREQTSDQRQAQAVLAKVVETLRQLSDQQQRFAAQLARAGLNSAGPVAESPVDSAKPANPTGKELSSIDSSKTVSENK
jgi:hypothetical protein